MGYLAPPFWAVSAVRLHPTALERDRSSHGSNSDHLLSAMRGRRSRKGSREPETLRDARFRPRLSGRLWTALLRLLKHAPIWNGSLGKRSGGNLANDGRVMRMSMI